AEMTNYCSSCFCVTLMTSLGKRRQSAVELPSALHGTAFAAIPAGKSTWRRFVKPLIFERNRGINPALRSFNLETGVSNQGEHVLEGQPITETFHRTDTRSCRAAVSRRLCPCRQSAGR